MKKRISHRKITIMLVSLVIFVGILAFGFSMMTVQPEEEPEEPDVNESEEQETEEKGEIQLQMESLFNGCYKNEHFDSTIMDYFNDTFYINISLSEEDRALRVGNSSDCTQEYFDNRSFDVNLTYFDLDEKLYQRLYINKSRE
ncbi:MAG: hypothetical protein ACLFTR_05865 [Candidatus Woesearchaeota archaeon]